MNRLLAALVAAFFMVSCGQSVTLPKEKAEYVRQEIEKIAREYAPIADEAFADESPEMIAKRAELRARLYTLIEFVLRDVRETDSFGLLKTLSNTVQLIMGAVQ